MNEIDDLLARIRALPEYGDCGAPQKFTKETLKQWQFEKEETLLDVINAFLDLVIAALKPVAATCGLIFVVILIWFWVIPAIKYGDNPAKMDAIGTLEVWENEHVINDEIEIEWTNTSVPAPDYMTLDGRKFKVVIKNDD